MTGLLRILVMSRSKTRRKCAWRNVGCLLITLTCAEYFWNVFGVFLHLRSTSFDAFTYPIEGDVVPSMRKLLRGERPQISPINDFNISLIRSPSAKCASDGERIRVLFVVKSAAGNFARRAAIRKSWGFESRFSDVTLRTVFTVGNPRNPKLLPELRAESDKFADVIHADFTDAYFNNTLKTLVGMRWVLTNCPTLEYVLLVDDDYYVSVKNLLRFIRFPNEYPHRALLEDLEVVRGREALRAAAEARNPRAARSLKSFEAGGFGAVGLSDSSGFYVGYLFNGSVPKRSAWSKWFVSLDEYPFFRFPPYITAGAILMDRETLLRMYLGALFTRLFRFDDPYLGIVARKVSVIPKHSDYFVFNPGSFYNSLFGVNFEHVIAAHGYDSPETLLETWHRAKAGGHA